MHVILKYSFFNQAVGFVDGINNEFKLHEPFFLQHCNPTYLLLNVRSDIQMHLPLKNNVYILHSHPGDDLENNLLAQVTFGKWANYHLFLSIQQSPLDVCLARVALEKQIHYKWEQSQFHVFVTQGGKDLQPGQKPCPG